MGTFECWWCVVRLQVGLLETVVHVTVVVGFAGDCGACYEYRWACWRLWCMLRRKVRGLFSGYPDEVLTIPV